MITYPFVTCLLHERLHLRNLFNALANEREVDFKVISIMNTIFISKPEYGLDSTRVVSCRV